MDDIEKKKALELLARVEGTDQGIRLAWMIRDDVLVADAQDAVAGVIAAALRAAPAAAGVVEQIAQQWDGCTYDAPGETIDIADAIRRAGERLIGEAAPEQRAVPEDVRRDVWQPIRTAPRDQTVFIAWFGDYAESGYFGEGGYFIWQHDGDSPGTEPTHWMPMPAAQPQGEEVGRG